MLFYILFIIGGIVVDQLTKYLAVTFLSPVTTVPVIPHVFHLTYVENTGAAFSIFAGKQIDPEKDDQVVLEVFQKGYTFKDKVIRPAMVKVNQK